MSIEFYNVDYEVPHNDVDVLVRNSNKDEYAVAYMCVRGSWNPVGVFCDGESLMELDFEPCEWAHLPK